MKDVALDNNAFPSVFTLLFLPAPKTVQIFVSSSCHICAEPRFCVVAITRLILIELTAP